MDIETNEDMTSDKGGALVMFPLARRAKEVRAVAAALVAKNSWRTADTYRSRQSDRLFRELAALGLAEDVQDEEVGAFFDAVEREVEAIFGAEFELNKA
ncbi:DUF6074 family protein [Mesorhizobium xinjiangense]|uniref:DUF6074 family protein n=1 Tax=Mesorhizobium xinjiangense TaxID=2678685 RepID=UPI0012EE9578|nr:DUF6074 family protein [Mesorhizobium xinjiangense]